MDTVKQQVDEFVDHLGEVPQDAVAFVHRIDKPGHLADIVTYAPAFEFQERLDILNEIDPVERLRKGYMLLARQLELLKLRQKIQQDTKEVLDQSQREYFLREQMRVIRRELGEDEDSDDPIDELRRKIAELKAPDHVKEQATHELKRLAQQGMNSPEAGVIRTYLDWLLAIPWNERTVDELEITRAREVLDDEHAGHDMIVGEMPGEELLVDRDVLDGDDAGRRLAFEHSIDQQEGVAMGQILLDLLDVHGGQFVQVRLSISAMRFSSARIFSSCASRWRRCEKFFNHSSCFNGCTALV